MVDDADALLVVNAYFQLDDMGRGRHGSESYKSDCGLGDPTEWKYTLCWTAAHHGCWFAFTHLDLTHQPMNNTSDSVR